MIEIFQQLVEWLSAHPWWVVFFLLVAPNVPVPASFYFPFCALALVGGFGVWLAWGIMFITLVLAGFWAYALSVWMIRARFFRAGLFWGVSRLPALRRYRKRLLSQRAFEGPLAWSFLVFVRFVPGVPLFFQNWILGPFGIGFRPWFGASLASFGMTTTIWVFGMEAVMGLFSGEGSLWALAVFCGVLVVVWLLRKRFVKSVEPLQPQT